MTRTFLLLGAALMLFGSVGCRAEGFAFEVKSPKFRITIPHLPEMSMKVHPMHEKQAHLRYLGTKGTYTVSIFTPAAAAGMTPLECASSIVRTLASRPGVPQPSQVYKSRVNDSTFIAIYSAPLPGVAHLHAHVMSAVGGTHCIEVHASRVSDSPDDLKPWLEGFTKANVDLK